MHVPLHLPSTIMRMSLNRLFPVALLSVFALVLAGCADDNLVGLVKRWETLSCCGLIIVVLDIIAIMEVAGSARDTGSKVLWILLILFFPIGGLIFYYLFGK